MRHKTRLIKRLKSQVTLMIILSLVILIAMSFVIYLKTSVAKKQVAKEAAQAQQIKMNVQPIIEYVNQCLAQASRESLSIMGKQGGYIFESQGGLREDFNDPNSDGWERSIFLTSSDGFRVPYIITSDYLDMLYPNYPWETFPYSPTDIGGVKIFNPDSSLDAPGFLFGFTQGLLPELYKEVGGDNSIEASLEEYVKNKTAECADFTIFEEQGYKITAKSDAHIDVVMGVNDVGFRLTYPLLIESSDEKTPVQDFFIGYNVRLQTIYNEVKRAIINDVDSIRYDIKASSDSDMIITVEPFILFGNDELVRVADGESKILNENFEFRFARQNRKPALHYIEPPVEAASGTASLDIFNLLGLNTLNDASDPDEDQLVLAYQPDQIWTANGDLTITASDGEFEDKQIVAVSII